MVTVSYIAGQKSTAAIVKLRPERRKPRLVIIEQPEYGRVCIENPRNKRTTDGASAASQQNIPSFYHCLNVRHVAHQPTESL